MFSWLSLLLGDSRYIEKKLSECTRKNDEFNSLAKMHSTIVFLVLKMVVDENLLNNKTIILLNLAEYPLI